MQSLEARQHYSGTFDCMAKILRNEGILAFWRGATPRLARLMLSGGIVFTVVRPRPSRSMNKRWTCSIVRLANRPQARCERIKEKYRPCTELVLGLRSVAQAR